MLFPLIPDFDWSKVPVYTCFRCSISIKTMAFFYLIIRYFQLLCNIDGEKKSLSRDWERLSFFYAKNLRLLMMASTTRAAELMVIRVRWVKM